MISALFVAFGAAFTVVLITAARRAPSVDRVRRLRPRAGLPMPVAVRSRLGAALSRAAVDLTPDDAVKLWLLASVVGGGMASILSPIASIPVGIAVLVAGPVALWWARGRGDGRVVEALPGALDRVSAGLRAGSTVGESLGEIAVGSGALAPDLRRLDARSHLGVGLGDALAQWSRERPLPGVQAVSGALALAVSVGGACAVALEGLGESLRAREATMKEAHALSAQARMSAFVVGGAPVAYLVFVSLADPGSLNVLLTTTAGQVCLAVGLLLEGLAALWMRALFGTRSMTGLLLALAWGVVIALPVVAAARRAGSKRRARELGRAQVRAPRRSLTHLMPRPLRRVVERIVSVRRDRRDALVIGRELPLVLDLLQVAVSAGCTPYRALELTVRWGPPASGDAFATALDATRVGSSLRDALDTLATDTPTLTPVTDVLLASDRLGAPAGPALTRLAHDVRADLRRRAEARARTLPVKLLFPLVFLVLPAFGLLTVVPALLSSLART